jgi:hypothetical protein
MFIPDPGIIELSTQKIVIMLSKILGFGIVGQKAPDPGYGPTTLPSRINFDPKPEAATLSY